MLRLAPAYQPASESDQAQYLKIEMWCDAVHLYMVTGLIVLRNQATTDEQRMR